MVLKNLLKITSLPPKTSPSLVIPNKYYLKYFKAFLYFSVELILAL